MLGKSKTKTVKNKIAFSLGVITFLSIVVILTMISTFFVNDFEDNVKNDTRQLFDSIYSSISINGVSHRLDRTIAFLTDAYKIKEFYVLEKNGKIITANKSFLTGGSIKSKNTLLFDLLSDEVNIKIDYNKKVVYGKAKYRITNNKNLSNIVLVTTLSISSKVNSLKMGLIKLTLIALFTFYILVTLLYVSIRNNIFKPIGFIVENCINYAQKGSFNTDNVEKYRKYEELKIVIDSLSAMINTIKENTKALKESKDRAVVLSELKSRFLANMSHEIRTPLNSIIGFTNVLKEKKDLLPSSKELVEDINTSGNILLVLINDILDHSKIEAGELEIENVDFSVNDELDKVLRVLSSKANEKDIYLDIDTSFQELIVKGDPTRFTQIIINILSNAIKFTEKGSITVKTHYVESDEDHIRLYLDITDTGIGLSEHEVGVVFQSFRQANSSINRKYGGTGLGLAISKYLIEKMGGTINVESKLGVGTSFRLRFIMRKGVQEKVIKQEQIEETHLLEDKKILLVEDNDFNKKLFLKILEKQGGQIDIANTGLEALEMVEMENYDFIFMDIQMPEMDGLTATKIIRNKLKQKDVIIIGLSANAFYEDKINGLNAGMDAYLSKPIVINDLLGLVSKFNKAA
ncbi:MAG: ATP-binding protein [Bacteriovoracaceae bacterium]